MNNVVKIVKSEVLSDNWYILRKVTFDVQYKNGEVKTHSREAYDRGNGATILLYNKQQQTVVLTRQFRLPTVINGNETGIDTGGRCGSSNTCSNGAINPTLCTVNSNGQCINGMTNPPVCTTGGAALCSDSLDNNGDGKIDVLDSNCHISGVLTGTYVPTHYSESFPPTTFTLLTYNPSVYNGTWGRTTDGTSGTWGTGAGSGTWVTTTGIGGTGIVTWTGTGNGTGTWTSATGSGTWSNGLGTGGAGTGTWTNLILGQTATPPNDAIVRYHEGIETVFTRQILANPIYTNTYGYREGNDLMTFAWDLSDQFARKFGYVNKNGKEIRVSYPDIAAYQLQLIGNELTVYEYYDNKIVDVRNITTVFKNASNYEYYFTK